MSARRVAARRRRRSVLASISASGQPKPEGLPEVLMRRPDRDEHRPLVAVTFPAQRERLAGLFGDAARVVPVADLPEQERARTLRAADVLFVWNWRRELRPGESRTLHPRFVQLLSAGADQLPFAALPPGAVIASNVGAYAEPMAEHAVAMALALLKRLPQRHAELAGGV